MTGTKLVPRTPSPPAVPRVASQRDDAALMSLVGRGDRAVFERLVRSHSATAHSLAWRMLGERAEAEDVVQEVFCKLWVTAPRWASTGGGLGAWLRRVTVNACLDRLRRLRPGTGDLPDELPDTRARSADEALDAARQAGAVAAAVAALPPQQHAAVVLTYQEGVSNAEAAAALGIGVKALESLLVRARRGLTAQLRTAGYLDGEA